MNLIIYIDGGSRGNPGPASAGVLIHQGNPSQPTHEAGYFLGYATNNTAEYTGLLIALKLAVQLGADEVSLHSDSQLMVRQIQGKYRVKSPSLKPLYDQAKELLSQLNTWKITHVRREFNTRADELANLSMDAGEDVIVTPLEKREDQTNHATISKTQNSTPKSLPTPPRLIARISKAPGPNCPAATQPDQAYRFGPATPEGFCIYAAEAVLKVSLHHDFDAIKSPPMQETPCTRCGIMIKLEFQRT